MAEENDGPPNALELIHLAIDREEVRRAIDELFKGNIAAIRGDTAQRINQRMAERSKKALE